MSSLFAKRNYFWNWSWTAAGGKICFNHTHKEGQEKCNNLTNSFNNFDKSMLQVWQPEPASTIFARQYRLSEFLTRQDKDRAWFRLFVYFFEERKTIQHQYYHFRSDKYVTLIRNGSLFATILVKVWKKVSKSTTSSWPSITIGGPLSLPPTNGRNSKKKTIMSLLLHLVSLGWHASSCPSQFFLYFWAVIFPMSIMHANYYTHHASQEA